MHSHHSCLESVSLLLERRSSSVPSSDSQLSDWLFRSFHSPNHDKTCLATRPAPPLRGAPAGGLSVKVILLSFLVDDTFALTPCRVRVFIGMPVKRTHF